MCLKLKTIHKYLPILYKNDKYMLTTLHFCSSMCVVVDVLVLGFANLVADGISMGLGDYVATSTQKAVAAKERAVTKWDVRNQSGPQQMDLLHQYQALGMNINDATTVRVYIYRPLKSFKGENIISGFDLLSWILIDV